MSKHVLYMNPEKAGGNKTIKMKFILLITAKLIHNLIFNVTKFNFNIGRNTHRYWPFARGIKLKLLILMNFDGFRWQY